MESDIRGGIHAGPYRKWVARYNGPGDLVDRAHAMALDADGNVYVTGFSEQSPGNIDCTTVKYDTEGNELWITRYNGTGNDDDHAYALALDADGNVYVTGPSDGSGTFEDYATIKYGQTPPHHSTPVRRH